MNTVKDQEEKKDYSFFKRKVLDCTIAYLIIKIVPIEGWIFPLLIFFLTHIVSEILRWVFKFFIKRMRSHFKKRNYKNNPFYLLWRN